MSKNSSPKVDLLEHFYEHLSEDDWLEGVDLYQAGRVQNVQTFHRLITAQVPTNQGSHLEVRLKVHPSGRVIQWIECTCKKNRRHGQYCEHIAALMIHVDREKAKFLQNLDLKMPLKPPSLQAKKRQKAPDLANQASQDKQPQARAGAIKGQKGASQSLLAHLKGSIQSVSLVSGGPKLRIKIEIKPGTVTDYELEVDEAADFLASKPEKAPFKENVESLRVFTEFADLGTRVF